MCKVEPFNDIFVFDLSLSGITHGDSSQFSIYLWIRMSLPDHKVVH